MRWPWHSNDDDFVAEMERQLAQVTAARVGDRWVSVAVVSGLSTVVLVTGDPFTGDDLNMPVAGAGFPAGTQVDMVAGTAAILSKRPTLLLAAP
jgi:hypothetical protein